MSSRWSTEELDYLSNKLGLRTHSQIAKRLRKTTLAVKMKATREGYTYYDNFYSYKLLSEELGVSRTTLRKYVSKGLLQGRKAEWKSVYGHNPMIFTEEDIVTFLRGCNGTFANRKIPNDYFRNVYLQHHTEVEHG